MHLERLFVPLLDDTALAHLAQLPSLSSLTIKSHPQSQLAPASSFQPAAGTIPFPALTRLTIPTMVVATSLITKFSGRPLTELASLPNRVHPTKDVARQFYSALAIHCSRSSLKTIAIFGDYHNPAVTVHMDQHLYSVDVDIIQPLLSFSSLVSVMLSHPVGFDLDDATILRMARAWPCLGSLTLRASPSRHMSSKATLEGLYAFTKYCPSLVMLEMTFDATVVPKIRLDGKKRSSQQALNSLHVALSSVSKPRRVAKFLSTIFPGLREIETLYDEILADQYEDEDENLVTEPHVIISYDMWKIVEDELSASSQFSSMSDSY
ncbi:hypothetical protein MVEN_00193900 [Mycena venus]|uniref:F-box domain-containing protein n=1 Tax=Mycena venus TaxID=2733690 RepID=A0A8H7DAU9_9AGAR|nr:hypothetical protein MVEN_00193900 [Mycena venus]